MRGLQAKTKLESRISQYSIDPLLHKWNFGSLLRKKGFIIIKSSVQKNGKEEGGWCSNKVREGYTGYGESSGKIEIF